MNVKGAWGRRKDFAGAPFHGQPFCKEVHPVVPGGCGAVLKMFTYPEIDKPLP